MASNSSGWDGPDGRTRRTFAIVGTIAGLSAVCCLAFIVSVEQGSTTTLDSLTAYDPALTQQQYWTSNPYQQIKHYENALDQARKSNAEMQSIISQYKSALEYQRGKDSQPAQPVYVKPVYVQQPAYHDSYHVQQPAYHHNYYDDSYYHDAYNHIQDAQDSWAARKRVLNRLHYEIVKSQNKLHSLHDEEQGLLDRHTQLKNNVASLLHSSVSTAHEIQALRDRYAQKIADMTSKVKDAHDDRMEDTQSYQRLARYGYEKAAKARANVAKAIATAAYYAGQVRQAKENVNAFRDRAERAESKASYERRAMRNEVAAALDQREKEKEAEAAREIAQKKAVGIDAIMRSKSRAADELAMAKAHLMEEATEAKVETGIADSAKNAVEKTEREEQRYKGKIDDLQYDLKQELDSIVKSKNKADTAEAKAKLYQERTDEMQAELEEATAAKEDAVTKAQEAVKMVEEAESKTALAKTQAKITEMNSKKENMASKLAMESVKKRIAASNQELQDVKDKTSELEERRLEALSGAAHAAASVTDAKNELLLAEEKQKLMELRADEALKEAEDKKAKAEDLLKTVDGLAALAREAAEMAAAERAKATGTSEGSAVEGDPSAYALPGFYYPYGAPPPPPPAAAPQSIDIHVIPHAPVVGPGGEEGLAYADGNDQASKKLRASGVNV